MHIKKWILPLESGCTKYEDWIQFLKSKMKAFSSDL